MDKKGRLDLYGTVTAGAKGYKVNPLDKDLNKYETVWMKRISDDKAEITNLGEKSSDQLFEMK